MTLITTRHAPRTLSPETSLTQQNSDFTSEGAPPAQKGAGAPTNTESKLRKPRRKGTMTLAPVPVPVPVLAPAPAAGD